MPPNNRARPALVQRTTISPAKERARHAPTKNQSRVPKWKNTTTLPIVFFVANFPSTFVKTPLPNASNANWGITATVNLVLNATPARIAPAAAKNSARLANTVKQEQQQTKARRAIFAMQVVTKFPVAKPSVPSATLADTRTKRAK